MSGCPLCLLSVIVKLKFCEKEFLVLTGPVTIALLSMGKHSETQALNQGDAAEAEGQKARPQQVPQSGQVGDGEVVRVQAPPPHRADDEVGKVKEDGHLFGGEH